MMWLLVAVLLVPVSGKPDTTVLQAFETKELCEASKIPLMKRTIEMYKLSFPLNFKLECRPMQP